MRPLHQRCHLYTEGDEAYVFAPTGESSTEQTLTIHRSTGDIELNPPGTPLPLTARLSSQPIYGVLGLINLSLSEYVVVVTGRELQGRLMGHDVFRPTEFDFLPLNHRVSASNPSHPVEAHLLALLRSHLQGGFFLFSYTYDLTRRMQAQWDTRASDADKAYWEVADDRFFWNKFLQTRLMESASRQDLSGYILPIMYGTFDCKPALLHGRHIHVALISRRSRFRAGTRYFRRGIDEEGHVANFNETEQLLLVEPKGSPSIYEDSFASKLSFVQIRGSVPVFWAEVTTLRYKPDLQVMDFESTPDVMKMHLQEQVSTYGPQTLVNLVNHKGHEQPVKEAYERYVSLINLPDVRYEYFDFHNECKNMRWHRISILIDKLADDLKRDGYFQVDVNRVTATKLQKGAVRTNCMDNLDRTNVVQAALAKWTLGMQLVDLDIVPAGRTVDDYEELSRDVREMWANHADSIANAYAGSGALKSDFTRTGVRSKKGLIEDGLKSLQRYLKNNYFDGPRQDGFDLFTGEWRPRKSASSSRFLITDSRPLILRSMPMVVYFSLFMICAGLTLPRTSDYSLLYYFLLWFTLLLAAGTFIYLNGIEYVSWPRLKPPTSIIYYDGPGFRSARHGMLLRGKEKLRKASGKGDIAMTTFNVKKHVD